MLYIICFTLFSVFRSDDSHNDYASDEVFDDTIESLQREITTEIGEN